MNATAGTKAPGTKGNVLTLGCRLNTLESEVIRDELARLGDDRTIVVNTCCVTSEAERQSRQAVRRAGRENPGARIVVTGCAAQLNPEQFAEMDEVARVIGNNEKLSGHNLVPADSADAGKVLVSDMDESSAEAGFGRMVSGLDGRARAFVMVQQGCDNTCTFCIIPTTRGHNRAIDINEICTQGAHLAHQGFNEIVLTGVDIAAYGDDMDDASNLASVIKTLLNRVPELQRLRLSSLDPARIDDEMIELFANEPRLMGHVHLSLQSMDEMVLKRMKRRHSPAGVIETVNRLRAVRPDMAFGADLIAGFPTETNEMAKNTEQGVIAAGIDYLHVFPYSPRPGTPAAKMPQVEREAIKARAGALRAIGERQLQKRLQGMIGKTVSLVMEKPNIGRSECFVQVETRQPGEPGSLQKAIVSGTSADRLVADLL